jgi:hypothetical protein
MISVPYFLIFSPLSGLFLASALALAGEPGAAPPSTVIPVSVDVATGMVRGGEPYFVKGSGGNGCIEKLAARGGNSIRTWTTSGLATVLDRAEHLGLTVSPGIWLERESRWFSYSNPADCDKQAERVRQEVIAFREHPALLAWGIGNESDGDGTNADYWKQLERLAEMVKELDPAHPTFTAIAGVNKARIDGLLAHTPSLDFLGVNTYGAIFGMRMHLQKFGWDRPWMLTEWGPRGFWESRKTEFGAPIEQTSTEKADMIRRAYELAISPDGGCLGSYAFVWGWKFEATATWFGIFTHQGESTAVADALQEVWGGGQPDNRAPDIEPLRGVPKSAVAAGDSFEASATATDPDGDPLTWEWAVVRELMDAHRFHKGMPMPKAVAGAVSSNSGESVQVTAPELPGVYRLYVWVSDGQGHAATANMPFEVKEK